MTPTQPPLPQGEIEARWLARLLAWQVPITTGVLLLSLWSFIAAPGLPSASGALLVAFALAVQLRARTLVGRGASGQASELICSMILAVPPIAVVLIPPTVIYLVLLPLFAVAIALPTTNHARFNRIAVGAGLSAVVSVAIGVPLLPGLSPAPLEYLLLVLVTAALFGLVLFTLGQYRSYLNRAMAEAQEANEKLLVFQASLEQEVQARSAALSSNLRLLEAITDTTPQSIFVFEFPGGKAVYVNRAAEGLYGRSLEELQRLTMADVAHPDDLPMLAERRARLATLADGEVLLMEYRLRAGSGEWRWMQSRRVVLHRAPDGQPLHILSVTTDITELKRVEEALQVANAELQQANAELTRANAELGRAVRLKDEFLANMSHELRTPLNNILGRAEALEDGIYGPIVEPQRHALASVAESGQHLLALISDILDLSKIEAEQLVLEREPVLVEDLCHVVVRMVGQSATARGHQIAVSLDPALPLVYGDIRRLKQILLNLLSNAVKFTPPGGLIGLEARLDREAGLARFVVWDTGIGIAADQHHQLFQPFVQLSGGLARLYEGTGLGLALVARLVALHGGGVSVASELGRGSRFTFTLPMPPEGPTRAAAR
jgi:PAS domain S-box-containing protein